MEINNEKRVKKNKTIITIILLIILLGILTVVYGNLISKNINKTENNISVNDISKKTELKKMLKTFRIEFSSHPYNTAVEYDFVNKTKTIIHSTSYRNENYKYETVKYDRFDELFDYLYNVVFKNNENLNYSSITDYGVVYADPKSYFNLNIDFNTDKEIPTFSENWHFFKNHETNNIGCTLSGYKLPSYWEELLEILEIDNSILSDGVTYDFNNSYY